ncbi:Uncharacterised protein [Candidatus Bilamarchaeum dharawalense]|uniref:NPCBM-associated, NEW3 domain of alpha-galactosidase n=1 Tax=Candidatus Bilamarchaeum dharawalense TaxID=2885759 RepID=A0A5E4LYJ9_9ARCH|nr:Uncharacterised protein [Candidatus Bilamarchaeum dharawalense]
MFQRSIFVLMFLLSLSFAINIVSPSAHAIKDGDIIDLGTIGPGQTVSILIDPKVNEGGIHGIGGLYDQAIAEDLPRGWTSTQSKLYQNPLQVTITADPNTAEGDYVTKVIVVDENDGEKLGNVTFYVKVRITWDVMDFEVTPSYIKVGPGQPARFAIKITNKGSTSDVFEVSSAGSKRWEFKKPIFVPAESSKTVYYEIVGTEEETYQTTIKVVSLASSNIADEQNVTLFIRSNLLGDFKATNNGVLVFPIFESLTYSLAGFLSNFLG